MTIKKIYYYLFYKLYKFSEAAPSRWWSEWKASLAIDALIYLLLFSIGGYYSVITKKDMLPVANPKLVICMVMAGIVLFNYLVFHYQDKWKVYVKEFDQWPKKENNIGGIVVWAIITLVFINLVFMFYLLSQMDWKLYK